MTTKTVYTYKPSEKSVSETLLDLACRVYDAGLLSEATFLFRAAHPGMSVGDARKIIRDALELSE